jgi:hypothetical protein
MVFIRLDIRAGIRNFPAPVEWHSCFCHPLRGRRTAGVEALRQYAPRPLHASGARPRRFAPHVTVRSCGTRKPTGWRNSCAQAQPDTPNVQPTEKPESEHRAFLPLQHRHYRQAVPPCSERGRSHDDTMSCRSCPVTTRHD